MGLVLVLASACIGGGLLMLAVEAIERLGLADALLRWMDRPHGYRLLDGEGGER